MEQATAEQTTALRGPRDAEREGLTGREAVVAAGGVGKKDAKAGERAVEKMSQGEKDSALDWFLSDGDDLDVVPTADVELNIGTPEAPRWITWVVRPLDLDTIDAIRQRHKRGSRAARRDGTAQVDEMATSVAMVVAATVSPNLEEVRQAKGAVNSETVLRHRFRHKAGLILQLAGKVMELSGYDDDDVREAQAARN